MSEQYLWRVRRVDNGVYETEYSATEPLDAPSDNGAIDTSKTTIIMPRFVALESDGYVVIDSSLADNQAIKITNSDAAGGIDIDAGTGGVTIDSDNVISIDAAAMINITNTSGNIEVDSAGLINLNSNSGINIGNDADAVPINVGTGASARTITVGNTTGATAININTGSGGFIVDTAAGGAISLDAVGASSNFMLTGTADAQDLTIGVTGGWDASLILSSTGTAVDAVQIAATNAGGGIDIDASTGGFRVDTTGTLYLASSAAAGGDITLDAAGGGGGVSISSGSFGIAINSGTGLIGIGHWSAGNMDIGTSATARTITIGNATGATAIDINTGTGGFTVDTTSGGAISLDAIGASSNLSLATDGDGQDLTIGLTGSNNSSIVIDSAGTGTDAIRINTSAGGIDIDSAGSINITTTSASTDALRLLATGGMDIDLGTSGLDLDTSGPINLATSEGLGGSITLDATTNNGGVSVSAGSQGIAINAAGTGTVGIGHFSGGSVLVGTAAVARAVTVGNNTTTTSLTLRNGTGGLRKTQAAPSALSDSSQTLTTTHIISGIMTMTPTVARSLTLPTAADMVAALSGIAVDDSIDFTIINESMVDDINLLDNTGTSIVGATSTSLNTSSTFRMRFTNVTASSEAFIVYRLG